MRVPTSLEARLIALLQPELDRLGYELVRLTFGGDKRPVLQIMAERPDGSMAVEDCERLSRAFGAVLDTLDPIASDYRLEVSSPGIDRPLTRLTDFIRWADFDVRITLADGLVDAGALEGRKRFVGTLLGLDDAQTHVRMRLPKGVEALLPVTQIEDARLMLTDALITAALRAQKASAALNVTDPSVAHESIAPHQGVVVEE